MGQGPAILTDAERAEVAARATPEFLDKRFAEVRGKLADPDGEFLLAQLQRSAGSGGNCRREIAIIVTWRKRRHRGGRGGTNHAGRGFGGGGIGGAGGLHAMIVADPFSRPSDQKAAEGTLAATNQAVASVVSEHPEIGVWVVGAHRGYVENAQRVKADVTLVSIVGTLLVGLAIAIYFRRVSTALLCIIPPSVGVGVTLGLAGVMRVELPLILLGFAGLLCGSTTDYGIQLIAECRRLARRDWGRVGCGYSGGGGEAIVGTDLDVGCDERDGFFGVGVVGVAGACERWGYLLRGRRCAFGA